MFVVALKSVCAFVRAFNLTDTRAHTQTHKHADETISIVEANPDRFRITPDEMAQRKGFIEQTKHTVKVGSVCASAPVSLCVFVDFSMQCGGCSEAGVAVCIAQTEDRSKRQESECVRGQMCVSVCALTRCRHHALWCAIRQLLSEARALRSNEYLNLNIAIGKAAPRTHAHITSFPPLSPPQEIRDHLSMQNARKEKIERAVCVLVPKASRSASLCP